MAMEDSVRKVALEELKRLFPEVFNDLFQRLERKMNEKPKHVIPQILNQTNNIMPKQANGVIAHNSQLPRSMPTKGVQPASDLQLAFTEKLLLPSFREDVIKDKDHNHFQVSLMQFKHGQSCVFSLHSPIEVEIVVLDGGFPRENSQDWNTDEFNSSILEKRENKRSLLLGESKAQLRQGIASFGTLKVTDNSSWVRTGKFRLGVRVSPGSYKGPRIKEAITESFRVLDHRSKSNQKPQTPSLDHEVWRLLNIGRNGAIHRRLDDAGIKTVHDFLKLSVVAQQCLRDTIKMSDNKWEETIGHARTCRLGDDLYLYDKPPFTVKLNPICEVVEVRKNGVSIALTQLTSEETVQHATEAYQNWNRLERVPGMPSMIGAQKQSNSIKKCGLESDEPMCSNPLDGSQRELSAGNVTPRLGASVCVLEQLPSPQRAGAENQNRNPSDSNGGTMEAQQQSDHFGDLGRSAALWSPSSQLAWSPSMFCGTGESPGEINIGDNWQ
ncbi:protein SAR DEFICIENT 1-like isoform X3 [Musa acuminata AAA Group]|uniref:protein SAR DEFICIENT 1-like isoform X3 n=1 Tax=Musa acuminata AAA Group TaxID=214697 RepID=UPI0031DF3459